MPVLVFGAENEENETQRKGKTLAHPLSRRAFTVGSVAAGLAARPEGRALAQEKPAWAQEIDTVDGTFPLTAEKVTFRILVAASPLVEDYATNEFTRWYEEKTNVHIEWDVLPPQEAQAGLNVRLASGDLPDILFNFRMAPPQQLLYGAQGVFVRLNDLIDEYGVETARVFEEFPLARDVVTTSDGSIYSLPEIGGCFHCAFPQKLWIYRPWLEQLGLAMPATTDEFEQVLLAFKNGDPNGDGEADEVPLVGATTGANPFDLFFINAFAYNPGAPWLTVPDGKVTAVYAQDAWKEGVQYLARLSAQDLIAPESFTQNGDQLRTISEHPDPPVMGSVPALAPSAFMAIDQVNGGRWTEYVTVPPLAGPEGVRYAARDTYQGFISGAFLIASACERPEIAFRWADGLYDLETSMRAVEGVPGEHWRWAEPGRIGNNGKPAIWERLYSYGQPQNFSWSQTGVYFRPEELHSGQVADPARVDRLQPTILYRETEANYAPYQQPAEWTLPPLYFDEEQAQQVVEIGGTIADYVKQTFALAVTGQQDIDAEWSSYLSTLQEMGLDRYLAIYQAAYDARPRA